jgi:hypothetical protein
VYELFLILRRIQRDIIINVYMSLCKVSVILVRFRLNSDFLHRFLKNHKTSNLMKIRPVGAEMFHADVRRDRQTYMTKLTVTIRSFTNVPKNKMCIIECNDRLLYIDTCP